ncbi:MAG: hypothetical protein DRN27_08040 [Thermoplasmata archaeon]|nr:MAG: hypothetical protein DRN27_08040 [Thermoplasmata archaeon]
MKVTFHNMQEDIEIKSIVMCYLLEIGLQEAIISNDVEYINEQIIFDKLCILNSNQNVDVEIHKNFGQYNPIRIKGAIAWTPKCVQIENDTSETIYNLALRSFLDNRFDFVENDKSGFQKNEQTWTITESIIQSIVENARSTVRFAIDKERFLKTSIKEHESKLLFLKRELISIKERINNQRKLFENDDDFNKASLNRIANIRLNELKSLHERKIVKHLEVNFLHFSITTNNIFIEHPEDSGIKWDMGQFIVQIPWSKNNVSILQKKSMRSPIWNKDITDFTYTHPHINIASPCWGQWSIEDIKNLLQKGEYALLVTMTIQWLEGYNNGNNAGIEGRPWVYLPQKTEIIDGDEYFFEEDSQWIDPNLIAKLDEMNIEHKISEIPEEWF